MPKTEKKEEKSKREDFGLNVEEMAKAGLHFGHKASKTHPKMKSYLYGMRNTVYIIDLEKTKEKFKEALKFIRHLVSENKTLLVVGTKIQTKDLVKNFALECDFPYVNERWLGGTLTNFGVIKKRINYFKDIKEKRDKGELEKYTKKERAQIDQELKDFEIKFGGIKDLKGLPDAIFVLDMRKDALAVKEARQSEVKVVGISDTNTNPTLADYPVPANDDAISSIKYILEKVKEIVLRVKPKEGLKPET